jgi:simple sugar transport system ATP-binding protein
MAGDIPMFELRGMSKQYGHVQALDGVDFQVGRKEVVGLLGDNGAGKSTLVRIMSGIESPDAGTVYRGGKVVQLRSRKDSERIGIETIYQDAALVGSVSIMRNFFAGRELTTRLGLLDIRTMNGIVMDVLLNKVCRHQLARSLGGSALGWAAPGRRHRPRRLLQDGDANPRRAY